MQSDWSRPDRQLERLIAREGPLLTRKQVEEAGLDPYILTRWLRHGRAERLQWGVYRAVGAGPVSHEGLLEIQLRIPYGVVCLASALSFHGLTTFIPKAIEIAVPRERKPPKLEYPPLEVFFFTDKTYSYGVEEHLIGKQTLKVYSKEKTLADLLRFRREYQGLFLEGLRNYLTRPKSDLFKLKEAAKVCRVESKLQPLLEALLHEPTT